LDTTTLLSIHVLDVATMTWTKGPDVSNNDERLHAACAVSNDQFIAWGGQRIESLGGRFTYNSTLILDLKTTKWVSKYTAGPPLPTTRRSFMPSASSSSSSSNSETL